MPAQIPGDMSSSEFLTIAEVAAKEYLRKSFYNAG
jgi:hypothetical protein